MVFENAHRLHVSQYLARYVERLWTVQDNTLVTFMLLDTGVLRSPNKVLTSSHYIREHDGEV